MEWVFFRFVTMHAFDRQTDGQTDGQRDGQTDRRTDRIPIAIPRLHSMQRGKNVCWRVLFSFQILASSRTAINTDNLVTSMETLSKLFWFILERPGEAPSSQISRSATGLIYILYVFCELFAIWRFNFTLKWYFVRYGVTCTLISHGGLIRFITCVYNNCNINNASRLLTLFVDSIISVNETAVA